MKTAGALIAFLLLVPAVPVRADDVGTLQSKIGAALKAAHSFVATSKLTRVPYQTTTVYVAPDRTKTVAVIHDPTSGKTDTTETITIGSTLYVSRNGVPFVKSTMSSDQLDAIASITTVEIARLAPDVVAGGRALGAYTTLVGSGNRAVTMTCTYDKTTYRIVACSNEQITQTFGSYDDPANTIEAPKETH